MNSRKRVSPSQPLWIGWKQSASKALDNADDLRSTIKDEALLDSFSDAWNEAEVAVSSIEDNIRDMAKLTDFIEEKLV